MNKGQSKYSQVRIDNPFEGICLSFAYPSFDANISSTSDKYNHTVTDEQVDYIIEELTKLRKKVTR